MDKIKKLISNHIYLIVLVLLYILFYHSIRDFILSNIIPLFSNVADNSIIVQVVLIFSTIIPYIIIDYKKDKVAWHRIICIVFIFLAYTEYRLSPAIDFYGVPWLRLSYLDYCWITTAIIEAWLIHIVPPSKALSKPNAVAFVKETPTTKQPKSRKR